MEQAERLLEFLEEAIEYFLVKTRGVDRDRVFFHDAVAQAKSPDYFEDVIVPRVLASPKVTCLQHYLSQSGDLMDGAFKGMWCDREDMEGSSWWVGIIRESECARS